MNTKKIDIYLFVCVLILFAGVVFYNWNLLDTKAKLTAANNLMQYMQEELDLTTDKLRSERTKSDELSAYLEHTTSLLERANKIVTDLKNTEYELVYMGDFKITYYCDEEYEHICGYGDHMTASGKSTEIGWTAAADWNVIPNGSMIYISNVGFREVTDVGGAVNGKHIDVLVQDHDEALELGTNMEDVWILVKKGT